MKTITIQPDRSRSRRLATFGAALTVSALLAGCVAAGSSASPIGTGQAGPFASAGESFPASASPVESPSTTDSATPADLASPAAAETTTIGPHATSTAAPAGKWTGLKWTSAGKAFPQTPTPPNQDWSLSVSIFGWSGGYVGFRSLVPMTDAEGSVVVATSAADGLHWAAGRSVDTSGLVLFGGVAQVVEGPAGLLAVGRPQAMACGGPARVDALWTSTDGVVWARVPFAGNFGSATIYTVDAGSTGYIATGASPDGATQFVWLSHDGWSWHEANPSKSTFGKALVQGATNFAGGYVIAGAVPGDEGCGGYQTLTPSLWWSVDGAQWIQSKLTGAAPAAESWMTVTRINDHCLMAVATESSPSPQVTSVSVQKVWVTTDGQTWSLVMSPSPLLGSTVLTNGQRGVVVLTPTDNKGPATIASVGNDLAVSPVSQSGDGPTYSDTSPWWRFAMGPGGVVAFSDDGTDLRVGAATV
jgi:hypothetical protein